MHLQQLPLIPTTGSASSTVPEGPLTMSSKEIAELTGKEHFNVRRDITSMLQQLGQDALSFEGMSKDAYGRGLPVFNLPKDLTITLVAGYNVTMRHRIVTRWMELVRRLTPSIGEGASPATTDLLRMMSSITASHHTANFTSSQR